MAAGYLHVKKSARVRACELDVKMMCCEICSSSWGRGSGLASAVSSLLWPARRAREGANVCGVSSGDDIYNW